MTLAVTSKIFDIVETVKDTQDAYSFHIWFLLKKKSMHIWTVFCGVMDGVNEQERLAMKIIR